MQEKQDQKWYWSTSQFTSILNMKNIPIIFFFFFQHSQVLSNFPINHITIKEIKLFNHSLKHPFGLNSSISSLQEPQQHKSQNP